MFGLGAPELLIILVVVLVLFGGAKLPQLARSLGQAKNEFEAGSKEGVASADGEPVPAKTKEELERERMKAELRAEILEEEARKREV